MFYRVNQLHIEEKEVVHSIILNYKSHPFMLTTKWMGFYSEIISKNVLKLRKIK